MRTITVMMAASPATGAALPVAAASARAEETFDACEIFTQADAQKALGSPAEPEPVNPKAKRPKIISTCTWLASRDGKPVSASVTFRFGRTDADAQHAFEEEKLKFQTKPMLIGDATAFWSAKQGALQLLKGRTWIVVSVGGAKPAERDPDAARKIAELLEKKL